MKRALMLLVLAVVALAGLWVAGAAMTKQLTTAWLDARATEGWLVEYDGLTTRGFPTRFTTNLRNLQLADPETGWAWSAPRFTLEQTPFRPDRITAIWPQDQTLSSPFERLEITATAITADLDVQPAADMALDAAHLIFRDLAISSSAGWATALDLGTLDVTHLGDAAYDLVFVASDLTPTDAVATRLNPAGLLPPVMDGLRYEAQMQFTRPWDLFAIEATRPQIVRLELTELRATWGELLLRTSGSLDVDAQGIPTGELALRAENWRQMVEMAENAGVLPGPMRGTLEGMLGILAGLSGRDTDIDATLGFANGRVFLGPLPLGPAPRLTLR